jgi:hypothetical protein
MRRIVAAVSAVLLLALASPVLASPATPGRVAFVLPGGDVLAALINAVLSIGDRRPAPRAAVSGYHHRFLLQCPAGAGADPNGGCGG